MFQRQVSGGVNVQRECEVHSIGRPRSKHPVRTCASSDGADEGPFPQCFQVALRNEIEFGMFHWQGPLARLGVKPGVNKRGRFAECTPSACHGRKYGRVQWKTGHHFRGFSTIQQVRIGETCM